MGFEAEKGRKSRELIWMSAGLGREGREVNLIPTRTKASPVRGDCQRTKQENLEKGSTSRKQKRHISFFSSSVSAL